MTDLTELRMNVAALKRVDPYIKDILETATHVALYTFNADNNEWEKTDIEGALFVYSRNGEPYNSILIMNRLNTNNLVEPVTLGLDLQLQEPFLLYRNSKSNIYGIWFYDKVECIRIAAVLNTLVKDSELNRKVSNKVAAKVKKDTKPTTDNVDIFSMLSKAQKDFNTTRGNAGDDAKSGRKSAVDQSFIDTFSKSCGPLTEPVGPDVTSQSVMDFFAKAKGNTGHFKAGDQPNPGNVVVAESKPLLARLMSHPAAHTLEHIEKQQRSTTPQSGLSAQPQPRTQSSSTPSASKTGSEAGSTYGRTKKQSKPSTAQEDSGVSASQENQPQANQNGNDSNDLASFLRVVSPSLNARTNVPNSDTSNLISGNSVPLSSLFLDDSISRGCNDISGECTVKSTSGCPALIPPVMFAAPSPAEPISRPLEPLTRNQLLQAFNYLLRSDPEFINKLHEAYVKSFGEILS